MKKKKKKVSIRKLQKKLWKLVSEFVRSRDKNICFTCGRYAEGSSYHAGHFISASVCPVSLKYDLGNIHGQCFHCNINLSGNWPNYYEKMIQVYGMVKVEELMRRRGESVKWFPADYEREISKYD
jgi:hypothetical protein